MHIIVGSRNKSNILLNKKYSVDFQVQLSMCESLLFPLCSHWTSAYQCSGDWTYIYKHEKSDLYSRSHESQLTRLGVFRVNNRVTPYVRCWIAMKGWWLIILKFFTKIFKNRMMNLKVAQKVENNTLDFIFICEKMKRNRYKSE